MEEKERYINQVFGLKGHYKEYVFDTYLSDKIEFNECYKVLNQQNEKIKELEEENQQLKQQLNDLPKKIVEEIEEEIVKYDLLKNSPNEAGYCMFDSILDTILEKYGGENE